MKDLIGRAVSLGLGLAVASKEQIEKTVEELVNKGEVGKAESRELADDLIRRGEASRRRLEEMARDRVQAILNEMNIATREDIARLERRLEALERSRQDES